MALGVGGAAAAGLESGFNMGLRADEATERRKQTGIENERRAGLDADVRAERERNNALQDDDRAVQAFTLGLEDQRYALGALHEQYKDAPGGIPDAEAQPIYGKIKDIHAQRQTLLDKRSKPIIEKAQQEARDLSSRMAAGTANALDLPSGKFGEYILASTGIPVKRFVNGEVGAAISDAQAGLETQNYDLVFKAANVLLPEIKQGIGTIAPDGSVIVDKELVGFAPAPMGPPTESGVQPAMVANPVQGLTAALNAATAPDSPAPAAGGNEPAPAGTGMSGLQPGSDPDKLVPVLKVTTRQPDGRLTSYPAPITVGRSADPNAPIAPPTSMKALMDRLGQLTVLNTWMQKPDVKAKAEGASKESDKKTTFNEAWGMVHGDLKLLQDAKDPVSQKIAAIRKLQVELGVSFEEAARQFAAKAVPQPTGVAGTLAAIKTSGLSEPDKKTAERVALKVEAAPKAPGKGTGVGGAAPIDPASAAVGDELFKMLKPNDQAIVEGLIDGSIKPETLSVRNNHREMLVGIAARVAQGRNNGTGMNTATAGVNTATEKAFTSGRPSQTLRAMNTAVDHLDTLGKLAKALNNSDVQAINALKNTVATQFGDVDITNFDAAKQIVADEVIKAVVASGGSVGGALADREKAEAQIKNAKTPAQLQGVIDTFTKLMVGQINSLGQQYVSGGGTKDFTSFLTPGTKGLYTGPQPAKRGTGLSGGGGGGGAAPAPGVQTATNPKTGEKIQLVNGNWVPVK